MASIAASAFDNSFLRACSWHDASWLFPLRIPQFEHEPSMSPQIEATRPSHGPFELQPDETVPHSDWLSLAWCICIILYIYIYIIIYIYYTCTVHLVLISHVWVSIPQLPPYPPPKKKSMSTRELRGGLAIVLHGCVTGNNDNVIIIYNHESWVMLYYGRFIQITPNNTKQEFRSKWSKESMLSNAWKETLPPQPHLPTILGHLPCAQWRFCLLVANKFKSFKSI